MFCTMLKTADVSDARKGKGTAADMTSRSPREVQAQLLEVTRQIASQDFPNPWDSLLPDALASLACGDPTRMYGSLQILRKVASSLEFASEHAQTMRVSSCGIAMLVHEAFWHELLLDAVNELLT